MKKEKFMEAYESIKKIEDLLAKAGDVFDSFPISIQQTILNYHNEPATIPHCLRWGFQATKEVRENWHTVIAGHESNEEVKEMEKITIHISNPLLLDRLNTLAVEYSVPVELLINAAAKRLLDDVDFLRNLRAGKVKLE